MGRDELLKPATRREVERRLDLRRRPLAEADVARLALPYDLGQRLHRLVERRLEVVAVALIEVDVVGAQARERCVDLLEDLFARQSVVVGVHREVQLRREDVRVAGARGQHLPEELLRAAGRVHVRGVDEVDADIEGRSDARFGLLVRDTAAVREP